MRLSAKFLALPFPTRQPALCWLAAPLLILSCIPISQRACVLPVATIGFSSNPWFPSVFTLILPKIDRIHRRQTRDRDAPVSEWLRRGYLSLNARCGQHGLYDGGLVELLGGKLTHVRAEKIVHHDATANGNAPPCMRGCRHHWCSKGSSPFGLHRVRCSPTLRILSAVSYSTFSSHMNRFGSKYR